MKSILVFIALTILCISVWHRSTQPIIGSKREINFIKIVPMIQKVDKITGQLYF